MAEPRRFEQRRADTLASLASERADAWVATASADGIAHMVPLSIGWTGEHIVLVTESRSVTARNLARSAQARVALGSTRDVVMINAELVAEHSIADAPRQLVDAFASQSGWNPADEPDTDEYRLLALRPVLVQAWREGNEIAGRTLMKDGKWQTHAS